MSRRGWVITVILVLLIVFAVQGGEYSTFDWLELRDEVKAERIMVGDLKDDIDSLSQVAKALDSDPATQERAARELYGMIREGEFLYKIEDPAAP